MKGKVVLAARVNDGTKSFPFLPVKVARSTIIVPVVRRDGKVFGLADILGFYARYPRNGKRQIVPLGKNAVAAYNLFLNIEQDFARTQQGLRPIHEGQNESLSVSACAETFKANIETLGKSKATIAAYSRAVDDFAAQFPSQTLNRITKQDMIAHIQRLKQKIKTRMGDSNYTFRNRLRSLTVFFNSFDVKIPLAMRELAKPMKSRPTRFSVEVIQKLISVADEDEKDYFYFFLESGFRDEEVAYAQYEDIDLKKGSLNAHAKPEYNWKPKDHEARAEDIVLRSAFVQRMKARMDRHRRKDSDLIFPQKTQDKPDMHLIRIIKRVAERAGITGKRITQHAIRRTFGSMVAKAYGLEQARIWLGHSDIETTQRYIAAEEMTTEQSRAKVEDMFEMFGR